LTMAPVRPERPVRPVIYLVIPGLLGTVVFLYANLCRVY